MSKSFCFMRLRTAGIVVGWLGIAGSTLSIIVLCAMLEYSDVMARHFVDTKLTALKNDVQVYNAIHESFIVSRSIYLGASIIQLLISILLVVGTLKKRHLMLLPWLIIKGICIVFMFLYALGGMYYMIQGTINVDLSPAVFTMGLSLALTIYIFRGMHLLYQEIKLEKSMPQLPLKQTPAEGVPHETTTYPNYAKI